MATPAPTPNARPRPYRRFLTSAFHSRFAQASSVALLVALDNTFWLSDKRNIWSWFPIGPASIKILLLFFTSLYVFILHVATLNIGKTTTPTPFAAFRSKALSTSTPQIFFWFIVSAWWFSEIYIWTSPSTSRLGWVTRANPSLPDRLNERPIYVRAALILTALVQSAKHLYFDYSSLYLPLSPPSSPAPKEQSTHLIEPLSVKIQQACLRILWLSVLTAAPVAMLGPLLYTMFLRQSFWWIHLQIAKPIFDISRADARPVGFPPCSPVMILMTFGAQYLLVLTWEATTFLFCIYLSQEPLKKQQPLSAGSKDSNGTLVNGLKAKRDVVKTFAFWELAVIAQRFPDRRKQIFADIDHPDGARWSQMLTLALDVIRAITTRMQPPPATSQAASTNEDQTAQIVRLPKIVPDVSDKKVLANSPKSRAKTEKAEVIVGEGAKWIGQSEDPWKPPSQDVKGLLEYVKPPGPDADSQEGLFNQWWTFLQTIPFPWFFKGTPERRINALVLGSPHGNAALVTDAIEAVTKMLAASLAEDVYGKAIAGVPEAVRVFTKTINAIEELLGHSPDLQAAEVAEVLNILKRLKMGLAELLSAFQLYLSDVGLGVGEMNDAKKAAAQQPQPTEEQEDKKLKDQNDATGAANGGGALFGKYKKQRLDIGTSEEQPPAWNSRDSDRRRLESGRASRPSSNFRDARIGRREMETVQ